MNKLDMEKYLNHFNIISVHESINNGSYSENITCNELFSKENNNKITHTYMHFSMITHRTPQAFLSLPSFLPTHSSPLVTEFKQCL